MLDAMVNRPYSRCWACCCFAGPSDYFLHVHDTRRSVGTKASCVPSLYQRERVLFTNTDHAGLSTPGPGQYRVPDLRISRTPGFSMRSSQGHGLIEPATAVTLKSARSVLQSTTTRSASPGLWGEAPLPAPVASSQTKDTVMTEDVPAAPKPVVHPAVRRNTDRLRQSLIDQITSAHGAAVPHLSPPSAAAPVPNQERLPRRSGILSTDTDNTGPAPHTTEGYAPPRPPLGTAAVGGRRSVKSQPVKPSRAPRPLQHGESFAKPARADRPQIHLQSTPAQRNRARARHWVRRQLRKARQRARETILAGVLHGIESESSDDAGPLHQLSDDEDSDLSGFDSSGSDQASSVGRPGQRESSGRAGSMPHATPSRPATLGTSVSGTAASLATDTAPHATIRTEDIRRQRRRRRLRNRKKSGSDKDFVATNTVVLSPRPVLYNVQRAVVTAGAFPEARGSVTPRGSDSDSAPPVPHEGEKFPRGALRLPPVPTPRGRAATQRKQTGGIGYRPSPSGSLVIDEMESGTGKREQRQQTVLQRRQALQQLAHEEKLRRSAARDHELDPANVRARKWQTYAVLGAATGRMQQLIRRGRAHREVEAIMRRLLVSKQRTFAAWREAAARQRTNRAVLSLRWWFRKCLRARRAARLQRAADVVVDYLRAQRHAMSAGRKVKRLQIVRHRLSSWMHHLTRSRDAQRATFRMQIQNFERRAKLALLQADAEARQRRLGRQAVTTLSSPRRRMVLFGRLYGGSIRGGKAGSSDLTGGVDGLETEELRELIVAENLTDQALDGAVASFYNERRREHVRNMKHYLRQDVEWNRTLRKRQALREAQYMLKHGSKALTPEQVMSIRNSLQAKRPKKPRFELYLQPEDVQALYQRAVDIMRRVSRNRMAARRGVAAGAGEGGEEEEEEGAVSPGSPCTTDNNSDE